MAADLHSAGRAAHVTEPSMLTFGPYAHYRCAVVAEDLRKGSLVCRSLRGATAWKRQPPRWRQGLADAGKQIGGNHE
jgi:hypothetical protein